MGHTLVHNTWEEYKATKLACLLLFALLLVFFCRLCRLLGKNKKLGRCVDLPPFPPSLPLSHPLPLYSHGINRRPRSRTCLQAQPCNAFLTWGSLPTPSSPQLLDQSALFCRFACCALPPTNQIQSVSSWICRRE